MTLTHHETSPDITDKPTKAELEDDYSFSPLRFNDPNEREVYKDYLHSLVGSEVLLSAVETHFLAELTGFLVTRHNPVEHINKRGQIVGISGRFVEFITVDDAPEASRYTFATHIRIQEELSE